MKKRLLFVIGIVFVAITVQNYIASDFGNILVFNQVVCVGRLDWVIGSAYGSKFFQ